MSNARKLQTEIDRVLKKVDEGVELFDDIWEKVYSAEQQSQKEKHEQDLKKEIKKLQRLRDQIKTWIGSSEVKDKDALLEARRLIETKMEQFKVCEKETKTKTYSKEGLAREEKLDPAEEAKRNTAGWITDYIERLRQLVQDREVEIERLQAGKGKKSNKLIIDEYTTFLLNHRYHVSKLEGIMRLVNNDRLDPELVDNIKDDLDYYMDSYEDDEYQQAYDENFFYESLGLDELDVVVVDRVTQVVPPAVKKASNDDSGSQASSSNMSSSHNKDSNKNKNSKKTPAATLIPLTIGRARVSSAGELKPAIAPPIPTSIGGPGLSTPPSMISTTSGPMTTTNGATVSATSSPTILPAGSSATTTPTKLGRASTIGGAVPSNALAPTGAASVVSAPAVAPSSAGRTTPTPNANATAGTSMAAILKRESEQQEKERQKALQQQLQQQQQLLREQQARAAQAAEQLRQQQQQAQQLAQRQQQEVQQQLQRQQQQQQEALRQQKASAAAVAQQEALQRQQQQQQQQQQQEQALRQQQQEAAAKQQAQLQQQVAEKLQQQQQQQPRSQAVGLDILASGLGGLTLGNTDRGETTNLATSSSQNTGVPPLATSASASTAVTGTSLGTSGSYDAASSYLTALNESLATLPNATESERTRPYTPSNPYPTPACYPSLPSTMFDNPAVFEKLGTDCLFFIFYYAQGTYQQYLAARELKKQSWRFHKKFMTWFQRHEEPKVTTDEYEQGTYVYFDYESGWCTRIKSDFRFEYIYLEDSLQ